MLRLVQGNASNKLVSLGMRGKSTDFYCSCCYLLAWRNLLNLMRDSCSSRSFFLKASSRIRNASSRLNCVHGRLVRTGPRPRRSLDGCCRTDIHRRDRWVLSPLLAQPSRLRRSIFYCKTRYSSQCLRQNTARLLADHIIHVAECYPTRRNVG